MFPNMLLDTKSQEKNIVKKLADLDKKAQELEERLNKAKIDIHNLFWELVKLRNDRKTKEITATDTFQ